ncbi:LOW QUALITY PROTEIN: hypothetical protein V1477_017795 [Vespula maculifrons]|uniref:Ribosomal protein S1 n=1 Tax=Vespula maculifrons TaxID=7453 RepID=A0ABD2B0G9_VESMC
MGMTRRSHSNDPGLVFLGDIVLEKKIVTEIYFFPLFPLNRYNSAPIDLDKKIWACRARRPLSSDPGSAFVGAIVSEKKIVTEIYFFPLFPLNRYNSVPIRQILIKEYVHVGRVEPFKMTPVRFSWVLHFRRTKLARRAPSSDPGSAFVGSILSGKKIVKEKFFFPLFHLNRYYSAPIGRILIKKIWACSPRRSLSNGPSAKILFQWPDLDKKIWACRARRALSRDPGQAFVGAIVSEKKIVKEKFFFPLFPLNHYNSASIGQILIKKYGRVEREEPFPVTPVRLLARRALSSDPGPAFVGAIVSEKKIVTEKFFFPLSHLNSYNSVPIGHILIKKIWPCRARRALSNGPDLDKKNRGTRTRRALSNDSGPAFQGAILSENKIVKEKFSFPLFPLNRYNSAPIG